MHASFQAELSKHNNVMIYLKNCLRPYKYTSELNLVIWCRWYPIRPPFQPILKTWGFWHRTLVMCAPDHMITKYLPYTELKQYYFYLCTFFSLIEHYLARIINNFQTYLFPLILLYGLKSLSTSPDRKSFRSGPFAKLSFWFLDRDARFCLL